MEPNLLMDDAGRRTFLIPEGTDLREGPLVVRRVDGSRVGVDPVQVEPFEVPQAEAKRVLKAFLQQKVDTGFEAFEAAVGVLGGQRPDTSAPDGGNGAIKAALVGLIGTLAGHLDDDPNRRAAADAKLDRVVDEVGESVGDRARVKEAVDAVVGWLEEGRPRG